jgi:hypothetical protein
VFASMLALPSTALVLQLASSNRGGHPTWSLMLRLVSN